LGGLLELKLEKVDKQVFEGKESRTGKNPHQPTPPPQKTQKPKNPPPSKSCPKTPGTRKGHKSGKGMCQKRERVVEEGVATEGAASISLNLILLLPFEAGRCDREKRKDAGGRKETRLAMFHAEALEPPGKQF